MDAKPENRPSDSATNMPPVAAAAAEGEAAPLVIEATTSATAGATDETPAPRARAETIVMPREAIFGQPPALPDAAAAAAAKPAATGGVEDPTFMPAPRNIPDGNPDDPAPAPGHVPRGDSRSFRRGEEFALIYRIQTFVVSRVGNVGKRGVWRVVEYPTTSSAANSYARECSRWLSDGYADFR